MRYRVDVDGRTLWLALEPNGGLVVDGDAVDADCVALAGGVYSVIVGPSPHAPALVHGEGGAAGGKPAGARRRGFREGERSEPEWVRQPRGGRSYEVVVLGREGGAVRLRVDGREREITLASERDREARSPVATHATAIELRAPMPGLIVAVHAAEGEVIEEGGSVCTLEAMKMENELTVPRRARVSRLQATAGLKVNGGDLLAVLVPE